jgi:MFS family permease
MMLQHFAAIGTNPSLRRAVAAYASFNVGEWATWIAILVFAFDRGGAAEAGLIAMVQLVPAAIIAPLAASLADRFPREKALLVGYLLQALAMAVTGAALIAGASTTLVYGAAVVTTATVSLTRPVHGSILPLLSRTPTELSAANVVSATVTSAAILIAPATAGVLLAISGPGTVFAVTALGCALGAVLVAGIRVDRTGLAPGRPGEPVLRELVGGIRAIAAMRNPRAVVALMGAGGVIEGATDILIVVLALDLLDLGEAGVGFLNSAVGAGGLAGAAIAIGLVGQRRLRRPFLLGLAVASAPLAIAGLVPGAPIAFAALIVLGLGRSVLDVSGRTLLQRVTPDVSLARVFGVLEGLHLGLIALGSVAVPALLGVVGPVGGFIAAGLWLPLVALMGWRALARADAAATVHVRELELLRGLAMFAYLPPPTIERLSSNLVPLHVPDGTQIVREGEAGDRFYIIDRGTVEVVIGGRHARLQGQGEGFGEIALLRNVPRTASVVARGEVGLFSLSRDVFLAAVAGHPEGRLATERLAEERLAATPP